MVLWTESNLAKAQILYDSLIPRYFKNYDEDLFNKTARNIGNSIFDIGPFFSGYMSIGAILDKVHRNIDPVIEHYNSRQQSGRMILQYLIDTADVSFEDFLEFLEPHCFVHKTTKQENIKLRKYQNNFKNWKTVYKKAEIELVEVGHNKLTTKRLKEFVQLPKK